MEKVIKDGKVAVLVSGGHGAGWTSWSARDKSEVEVLLFHPTLIEMAEAERHEEITSEWISETFGFEGFYTGGADGLYVSWVEVGKKFIIHEYDGAERLVTEDDLDFFIA